MTNPEMITVAALHEVTGGVDAGQVAMGAWATGGATGMLGAIANAAAARKGRRYGAAGRGLTRWGLLGVAIGGVIDYASQKSSE